MKTGRTAFRSIVLSALRRTLRCRSCSSSRRPTEIPEFQSLAEQFGAKEFHTLMEAWGTIKDRPLRAALLNLVKRMADAEVLMPLPYSTVGRFLISPVLPVSFSPGNDFQPFQQLDEMSDLFRMQPEYRSQEIQVKQGIFRSV